MHWALARLLLRDVFLLCFWTRSWTVHKLFINCSWKFLAGWTRKREQRKSKQTDEEEKSFKRERIGKQGEGIMLHILQPSFVVSCQKDGRENQSGFVHKLLMNCSWTVHELFIIQERRGLPAKPETKPTNRRMRGEQLEAKENRDIKKHAGRKDWATMSNWNWRNDMVACPGDSCS